MAPDLLGPTEPTHATTQFCNAQAVKVIHKTNPIHHMHQIHHRMDNV
jgi:hypothetical protein